MNKEQKIATGIAAAVLAFATGYGLYILGMEHGTAAAAVVLASTPASATTSVAPQSIAEGEKATRRHISAGIKAGDVDPANGRKILYYHDPMVPGNKFDKPAKSPFMEMMLVPVYAEAGDSDRGSITVSPRIQQSLGVRTALVKEGPLSRQLSAVGSVARNRRDTLTAQVHADIPEGQAVLARPGTLVRAQAPALPGVEFEGRVKILVPEVHMTTRTMRAGVELADPRGQLLPGMSVVMELIGHQTAKAIAVPTEAVIHTGKRSIVILAEEGGSFRPVEVQAGIESGDQTEIRQGLVPGQRIVVSSQFLIDSEASLKGVEARMAGDTK